MNTYSRFVIVSTIIISVFASRPAVAQKFRHPGIDQTAADLNYMKKQVLDAVEPYKSAFEKLKAASDTGFIVKSHTHVLRGPYGRPNIGGDDLSRSSTMAYNYALLWYITNDQRYADKAINILNAWSPTLWHFDYNDAKLLAAWTGHLLCNAAEILRYSKSGWKSEDINKFRKMLMTVYYPLIRFYYPQANGNWDGAIIHSIMAIGIFNDDRSMFDNAVSHFLRAPVNGSLLKYIYPNGQCQETARDQAHVQLGLGEFAGAAQIAYTQGVDLYSVGNYRLALGYEYTAKFLLGEKPHAYGVISERAKNLRDDYEAVYRHYQVNGIELPYTKRAADSIRPRASRTVLTALRAPVTMALQVRGTPTASSIGYIAGAEANLLSQFPPDAISVSPGGSLQQAIDSAASRKGWVLVKSGIHTIPATLKIPSNITIAGEGIGSVIFLDPAAEGNRDAMVNADNDLHDVTIRNLVIEGASRTDPGTDPNSTRSYRSGANRGGIIFRSLKEGQMKNISLMNVTVRNCTYNGVFISGATNLNITRCDFNENGSTVVPGPKLQHNLLLTHSNKVTVKDSRLDTSPFGSGIALDQCEEVTIINNEIARNAYYGVLLAESKNITISGNLVEANDRSGVMAEFLYSGCENVTVENNIIQYNDGFAVESVAVKNLKLLQNKYSANGNQNAQERITSSKSVLMK